VGISPLFDSPAGEVDAVIAKREQLVQQRVQRSLTGDVHEQRIAALAADPMGFHDLRAPRDETDERLVIVGFHEHRDDGSEREADPIPGWSFPCLSAKCWLA